MVDLPKTGGNEKSGKAMVSNRNSIEDEYLFKKIVMKVIKAINVILIGRFFFSVGMMLLLGFFSSTVTLPTCLYYACSVQLFFQIMIQTWHVIEMKRISNYKFKGCAYSFVQTKRRAPSFVKTMVYRGAVLLLLWFSFMMLAVPSYATYQHIRHNVVRKSGYFQGISNTEIDAVYDLGTYHDFCVFGLTLINFHDTQIVWGLIAGAICIANVFDMICSTILFFCAVYREPHSKAPIDQMLSAANEMKMIGSVLAFFSIKPRKNRPARHFHNFIR